MLPDSFHHDALKGQALDQAYRSGMVHLSYGGELPTLHEDQSEENAEEADGHHRFLEPSENHSPTM